MQKLQGENCSARYCSKLVQAPVRQRKLDGCAQWFALRLDRGIHGPRSTVAAMTSCTQTTGEQATWEQATGEEATREQTTGKQAIGEQATSE